MAATEPFLLDLSNNKLDALPPQLRTLKPTDTSAIIVSLDGLDLSRNQFTKILGGILLLHNLKRLNLRSSQIDEVSPSIGRRSH